MFLLPGGEECLHGEGAESPYTIHRSSRSGGDLGIIPVHCIVCPEFLEGVVGSVLLDEDQVRKRLTKGGIQVEE